MVIKLDGTQQPEVAGKKIVIAFTSNKDNDLISNCTTDAEFDFVPLYCHFSLRTMEVAKVGEPTEALADPSVSQTSAAQQVAASAVPVPTVQNATPSSPSFDCSKAATTVEKLICSTPELASADAEMASFYKKNLAASGAGSVSIKQSQRVFISARNQCSTVECIAGAYRTRYEALAQLGYVRE